MKTARAYDPIKTEHRARKDTVRIPSVAALFEGKRRSREKGTNKKRWWHDICSERGLCLKNPSGTCAIFEWGAANPINSKWRNPQNYAVMTISFTPLLASFYHDICCFDLPRQCKSSSGITLYERLVIISAKSQSIPLCFNISHHVPLSIIFIYNPFFFANSKLIKAFKET